MNIYNLLKGEITQKDLLNYYNATITYEELPKNINGYVFNYKGIYNVMINKHLSYYKKKKTILHELAHLKVKNHGPEFVEILDQHMPFWREYKKRLNDSKLDYMHPAE